MVFSSKINIRLKCCVSQRNICPDFVACCSHKMHVYILIKFDGFVVFQHCNFHKMTFFTRHVATLFMRRQTSILLCSKFIQNTTYHILKFCGRYDKNIWLNFFLDTVYTEMLLLLRSCLVSLIFYSLKTGSKIFKKERKRTQINLTNTLGNLTVLPKSLIWI